MSGTPTGRFEYTLRFPPAIYGRRDKVTFEYKRCVWEPDMHFGEMTAFKIAQKLGIPCCEIDLLSRQHPVTHKICETGCISYFEQGSDDILLAVDVLASSYARKHGIENYYLLDIDSIFSAVYELFKKYNRPLSEYIKFKKDFIVMLIFDLTFGNFDRSLTNWFIRKNTTTGTLDLYPMFDNEAILGFTEDIPEDLSYSSIANFNNQITSKVTTPDDRINQKRSDFRKIYRYLLENYPIESEYAIKLINTFVLEDLNKILDNLPEISDNRKKFAIKNFVYRSMTLNRIKEEHYANIRFKPSISNTTYDDRKVNS